MAWKPLTLHCKECLTELANREILMLAAVPPSIVHLAVKKAKEELVFGKLDKIENPAEGKSLRNCPFILHCRRCRLRVANVTNVQTQTIICFKTDNVIFRHGGGEIRVGKLKKIKQRLIEIGIEEINVSQLSGGVTCSNSAQPSEPMIYCDTSELSFTSRELDSLTRQAPRDYQRELFLSAMRGNTLVCLPTGSGKTLIAAMVLSCMKILNPKKLTVFLTDRIPLAYQQSDYIKSQVPDFRVETLVGSMENDQHKQLYRVILQDLADKKVDVLVLTHQLFLNLLAAHKPVFQMTDISVLVFDEAHHCHGNHPYYQIMSGFYKSTMNRFKPVILGLTASPAGAVTVDRTMADLRELQANMCSVVAMPTESHDLTEHSHTPETAYVIAPRTIPQMILNRFIELHIIKQLIPLIEKAPRCQQALKGLPVFSSKFRGALRRLIDRCHGNKTQVEALVAGEHAMHMLSVVDLGNILGYKHAVERLKDCVHRVVNVSSPKESRLRKMIGSSETFRDLKRLVENTEYQGCVASDKYEKLSELVQQFVSQAQRDETSRGIIFVSMRATAFKLCEQISSIPKVYACLNPAPFVGHGQGSYDGMTWTGEQEVVLKRFKSGETKLLVSTSVLEEGLDVPVCNLVVRFEGTATLRALVQSRGRASRRSGSTFVVICSDEKAEKDANDAILKERNMTEAVDRLMQDEKPVLQATQYECEVRKPNLCSPEKDSGRNIPQVERYTPRITMSVRNLAKREYQSRVIDFFNDNFEVMSSEVIPSPALSGKETEEKNASPDMAFELQANDDSKEFRSKGEFANHVTEAWCSRLTHADEEPLPVWLQSSLSKELRKPSEPSHLLSAQCMFLGTFVNRCHFRCEWPSQPVLNKVLIHFHHSLRLVTVFLSEAYKLEFRYDEMEDFVVVDNSASSTFDKVFLTLRHPPRLYRNSGVDEAQAQAVEQEEQQGHDGQGQNGHEEQENDSNLGDSSDESDPESEGFSTDEEFPDVLRNFHERYTPSHSLPSSEIEWERISDIANGSKAWGQCLTYSFDVPSGESLMLTKLLAEVERRFDKKAFYCRVKVSYGRFPEVEVPGDLPFEVKYAAESLLKLHPAARRGTAGTFGFLLQSKAPSIVLSALEKLKKTLEQDKFCDPEDTLQRLLSKVNLTKSGMQRKLVPGHCAVIKRAVITPTRLLVHPTEVMVKNRVLREFEPDNFLCVSIRDDDLSKLSAARGSIDVLLDGVNHALSEGLEIAGQRFLFLGSSNSQLRNHNCWFVWPSPSPDDIRRWMGDLSRIRCVASYMARMGQCFSTSLDAVGIGISQGTSYDEEHDVKTADQKYCFSDGVGRISEKLASEVVKKIAKNFKPSAFQIRFAGYKGVLALDPRLPEKKAFFRPSMRKFESPHRRLEVLQTSRPQVVYLNHQVIMLLSNLGVPDDVFMNLQNEMLDRLAGMLVDEHLANELLSSGAKIGVSYCNLSGAGIPLTTEPFFKSLLVAMYRHRIHDLLSRARILLPPAEARLMMGVMDELGVLKPGQVFVQYSAVSARSEQEEEFNKDDKRVLRGPVVVTRNPCLHPGDVRQLEAVEARELSHLVDCVVFPRQGSRPHPNEMAGGDLDGDLYFVCWNKDLLPRKPNFPPMDYDPPPKKEETEPITVADMTKFVVNYIRFDQLGVIDNAHKALADLNQDGVESTICLHLAELHSLAVDAPKTGKWPEMPKMKRIEEYPDFMMKTDRESYPSKKLLGKLYRSCRAFKDTASEKYCQKMRVDESFLLPGNEQYLDDAREHYQQYRDRVQALMGQYGIETEAEVFTGCFLRLRNRLRKEKADIAELVSDLMFALRSDFRARFFEEFGLDEHGLLDNSQVSNEMRLKASAWYVAAYCCQDSDPVLQNKRLLGFPWLINDVMLAMKQRPANRTLPVSVPHALPVPAPDVFTTVGESLGRLFNEEKSWLLEEFKTRVRATNSIRRHLSASSPNLTVTMVGSSATFLFHKKSDLDLCVLPRGMTQEAGIEKTRQAEILKSFEKHLKEEEQKEEEKKKKEEKNLFKKVRLVNKVNFPVLACKSPTGKLLSECQCSTTLACDLSSSPDLLPIAILVSNYMKSCPDLLPLLRVIHQWGDVSGISHHAKGAGITSTVLACLLLVECLRKQLIPNFHQCAVSSKTLQLLQGQVTDGDLYMEWERVVGFLGDVTTANQTDPSLPSVSLDARHLGETLMSFFQSHNVSFAAEIPEPLAGILRVRTVAELLDADHVVLVKEHMQRACQLLALYGDVQILLAISGSENYRVIFLPPLLSSYVTGVERSKAQAIAKKTGASSVTIRPRFPRSRKSLILEVKGSEPAMLAVERELERMTQQASRDRVSLMSGCFVEGASVVLYEGSRNVKDRVSLIPFYGARHPTHDGQVLHVPLLVSPYPGENTFNRFTEKFFSQLRILERDFDPRIHGFYEFAVHFGRIYLFSVPHAILEDSEAVTIAQLRANKLRNAMHRGSARTRVVSSQEIQYTDERERRRRKPKKPFINKENPKHRKRGKPSRSSFFTVVHSPERVKSFLRRQGFQADASISETYLVDIREEDAEFYMKFDHQLKFKEVKVPNLRWCVTDVKRTWVESEDPDDDAMIQDGRETDVRFLLQSRYALGSSDIRGTNYAKYEQILEPGSPERPFRVKEDLWKNVKLIRFSKSHKFSRASRGHDFMSCLTVYLNEVREYSRPTETTSKFGQHFTRWEVSLQPTLPDDLTVRTTVKTFLRDVWEFAFALSSFVSSRNEQ